MTQNIRNSNAVVGKPDVPMFSASEQPIGLGDILYEYETKSDKLGRYDRIEDVSIDELYNIKAYRVTQVNYTTRAVRLRCSRGCERIVYFSGDQCPRNPLHHSLPKVKALVKENITKVLKSVDSQLEKQRLHAAKLKNVAKGLSEYEPRLPK